MDFEIIGSAKEFSFMDLWKLIDRGVYDGWLIALNS